MEFLYSFLRRHFAGKPVDFQKSPSSDFIWRGTSSLAAKKCSSRSPRGGLVASLGNQWHREMLVVLFGYQNKGVLKELDNVFFQTSVQGALLGSLSDKVVKFWVDYQEDEQMSVTKSLTTEVAALLAVRFGIQVITAISCYGPVATVRA